MRKTDFGSIDETVPCTFEDCQVIMQGRMRDDGTEVVVQLWRTRAQRVDTEGIQGEGQVHGHCGESRTRSRWGAGSSDRLGAAYSR